MPDYLSYCRLRATVARAVPATTVVRFSVGIRPAVLGRGGTGLKATKVDWGKAASDVAANEGGVLTATTPLSE